MNRKNFIFEKFGISGFALLASCFQKSKEAEKQTFCGALAHVSAVDIKRRMSEKKTACEALAVRSKRKPLSRFAVLACMLLFELSASGTGTPDPVDIRPDLSMMCRIRATLNGLNCTSIRSVGFYGCLCDGVPMRDPRNRNNGCPTGATLTKEPKPLLNYYDSNGNKQYSIVCGNASYHGRGQHVPGATTGGGQWYRVPNPLFPYANGRKDTSRPLRMCWVGWHPSTPIPRSSIKTTSDKCSKDRANVAQIFVTCDYNRDNDLKCKNIIHDFIAGRVTFRPGESDSEDPFKCDGAVSSCVASGYRRNNDQWPQNAWTKQLYDRRTGRATNDKVIYYGNRASNPFQRTWAFADMQCLSDNIEVNNVCACPTAPPQRQYVFEPLTDSTCYCPDGSTLKADREGSNCNVTDTCPATEDPGKDPNSLGMTTDMSQCSCRCSNDHAKSFFVPLNTASCPVVDATTGMFTPPSVLGLAGDECKSVDEPPLACSSLTANNPPRNPRVSHPHVSSLGTGDAIICDNNTRARLDPSDNKYYCYKNKNCTEGTNTEPEECRSRPTTEPTDVECTETVTGGANRKCLTFVFSDASDQVANTVEVSAPTAGGNCPPLNNLNRLKVGPFDVGTVSGTMCGIGGETGDSDSDPLGKMFTPFCPEGTKTMDISTSKGLQCICVDPSDSIIEYTCDRGAPRVDADGNCECQVSRIENTCDYLDGDDWVVQGSGEQTCGCSTGWTLEDPNNTPTNPLDDKCEKLSSGNTNNRRVVRQIDCTCQRNLQDGSCTRVETTDPLTVTAAIGDGWSCSTGEMFSAEFISGSLQNDCSDLPSPPGPAHPTAVTCSKTEYVQEELCTDGGTYQSNGDKCVQACTPSAQVSSCRCVKQTSTNVCTCDLGWMETDNQCRKEVPANEEKCQCGCFIELQDNSQPATLTNLVEKSKRFVPFVVGDDTYNAIKEHPHRCVHESSPTCVTECCHKCIRYTPCPPSVIESDGTVTLSADFDGICPGDPSCVPGCRGGCCAYCPDGNCKPDLPGGCCPDGTAISDLKNCPTLVSVHGSDPKGIDMAFSSGGFSSVVSVYSLGSMDRPDYICWQTDSTGGNNKKVQRRDLLCPPREDCIRDTRTEMCQCQSWDSGGERVVHDDTYCEYASVDPMRFEEGIIKGDVPTSRQSDKFETDIRFFKTTTIVTP